MVDKDPFAFPLNLQAIRANKGCYSSIVDAAVWHDILHNQIKENIVIISNWKGTFIECKGCKRILMGKKGWFGKK